MLVHAFLQLLPILILTLGGYLLSRLYHLSADTLVKLIADFLMPMLVFHSLYRSTIEGQVIAQLAGSVTFLVVILTAVSYFYARTAGIDARAFMPSIIVMNSGFLGIPLMSLWGGIPAMNAVVMFDQFMTIYLFTLVVFIITGGVSSGSVKRIIQSPLIWAVCAGFAFRLLGIPVPEPILTTLDFGGSAAPPLAAAALGVSLQEYSMRIDRHIIAGLVMRFAGGFVIGLAAVTLFGITGITRTVVLVSSALPSAVFSAVLPIRYGVKSDFAGTMVVVSTILGIITIPFSFWLAGLV